MKTQTKILYRALLMWVAICCLYPAMGQSSLPVTQTTVNSCHNDGQVTAIVSGGTGPYVYTLAPYYNSSSFGQITQATPTFTGLAPGYYLLTVTDATGLSNNQQGGNFVALYGAFNTNLNVNPAVCPATTGSEYVSVDSPSLAYTYLWSTGATTDSITGVPVGANYSCTVTQTSTGCFAVAKNDSFGMYQTSTITGTFSIIPANCNNGSATVTPAGGISPYTYAWSTGETTATASGLTAGYYTVTITDHQGCSSIAYAYVTQAIVINTTTNVTAEHCNDANGTATITATNGSAPFTYLWSTGNTTAHITGLSSGSYYVTVTTSNGCTATNYAYVAKSTPITTNASSTQTLCTANTGTATVAAAGGTTPYTYYWTTTPLQTTAVATGLEAGGYQVTVTDAVGCIQAAYINVTQNTTLYTYLSATNPVCGGSAGSIDATTGGGSGPYSYLWNTGATTPALTNLHQSTYGSVTVTDALGCKASSYAYVELRSPIMLTLNTSNASCIYTADGGATASANGGVGPYTYHWSNGQTGATATGMLTGYYSVYVTDANSCSTYEPFNVGYNSILPCAVTIAGTVYDDHNADCIENGGDQGLTGVWIGCYPGGEYQWTNYGSYSFVLAPGTYSLAQAPPLYHTVVCPAAPSTITLTAGQVSVNNDFFNRPDSVTDLDINCIPYEAPVAGFTQHIRLFVRNLGTYTAVPDVVYMHSLSVTLLSSSTPPTSYDPATGRIEWTGTPLASNTTEQIDLYFSIPSSLATGYILNNSDTVYPIVGDTSIYNNFEDCQGSVVRSLDPNYVDVLPVGTGTPGYISATKDSVLRYIVHFQNTGTYPATYVTLKIPIDQNLDIKSFSLIGTSHYTTKISADANRILTIQFDNINLPDSFVDRLGSQGFAAFTFKKKKGLHSLETIHESANIYFDYNTPVPTNTTLNTIELTAGVRDINGGSFSLYPNPTQDNVTLDLSALEESRIQVKVYDVMGRIAMEVPYAAVPSSNKLNLTTSGLATGVYTVEVTGSAKFVQKLVKTDK